MTENNDIRWIHPEIRRKAVQNAMYRARSARWNLNTAILLFGIIIIILILSMFHTNIWITVFFAVVSLGIVWMLGVRKSKKLYPAYLEAEYSLHAGEWKDYYKCLGISPSADISAIEKAYERLLRIYTEVLSDKTRLIPLYSMMFRDAREAYGVLSDPEVRAEYDRIFWLRYNGEKADMDVPVRPVIISLSHSISQEVSDYFKRLGLKLPRLTRLQQKVVLVTAAVLLAIGAGGSSLAFASPESPLAAPFRGTAVTIAQVVSGALSIIEDVRAIGSSSERQIISTTVQLMRIEEHVAVLTPVTEPTNDMSIFPSTEHSLYPEYLDRRYSQFKYTIDANGIITVYTELSTTGPLLDSIKAMISSLEQ